MFAGVHTFSNEVFRHLVERGHRMLLVAVTFPDFKYVIPHSGRRNDLYTTV